MLTYFSVKNYRGFSDCIEWDLSNPNRYDFSTYAIKNNIIKNGIIYGPNGSGKSSFGLAIFDIVNHLSQKWKRPNYYENFVYAGNLLSPVQFKYKFKFNDNVVEYTYSKDRNGTLLSESLYIDNTCCFENGNGNITIANDFPVDESVKARIATSANSISLVNYLLSSFPLEKDHYLVKMAEFVNSMLWFSSVEGNEFIGLQSNSDSIDEFIIRENRVKEFSDFLFEISGQKFSFVTPKPEDRVLMCDVNGVNIPYTLMESTGTKSLTLLFYWLCKLEQASFVIIDEFDAFYHFRLSMEVCKTLFRKDCQVFLSSHNTSLMTNELLRPDCNFILNSNRIKPLCDCTEKELRFGHNIEKIYRADAFHV